MKKKLLISAILMAGLTACQTTGELKAPCAPTASLSVTETGCERSPINTYARTEQLSESEA